MIGWGGLACRRARVRASPAFESDAPALTHQRLFLYTCPPDELDLRYEGVRRHVPPPAGAISGAPAGSPHRVRTSECKDEPHVFLEADLVVRVAAEAFEPPNGQQAPRGNRRATLPNAIRSGAGFARVGPTHRSIEHPIGASVDVTVPQRVCQAGTVCLRVTA